MHLLSRICLCLLLLVVVPAGMAHDRHEEPGMSATVGELPGTGPYQRFIVKYREDSAPRRDPQAVQARLDRAAATSGLQGAAGAALELTWQRRLGVHADLFQAARPLDAAEARRLLQVLAGDPDVEYVEVDAMMGIPPIRGPMRQD